MTTNKHITRLAYGTTFTGMVAFTLIGIILFAKNPVFAGILTFILLFLGISYIVGYFI